MESGSVLWNAFLLVCCEAQSRNHSSAVLCDFSDLWNSRSKSAGAFSGCGAGGLCSAAEGTPGLYD